MVQLTEENKKLRHQIEAARNIASQAQRAVANWRVGALFGLVPAAVLRLVGFVPD